MNLPTQSVLFLACFGFVLGLVAALRDRDARGFWPFMTLTLSLVLWSSGYVAYKLTGQGYRLSFAGGLLVVPCAWWMTATLLFLRRRLAGGVAAALFGASFVLIALMFVPLAGGATLDRLFLQDVWIQLGVAGYLFGPLLICLALIFVKRSVDPSPVVKRRMILIFYTAFFAVMLNLLDFARIWGLSLPVMGKVAAILFLYVLYQSGLLHRSFLAQEIAGKVVVVAASALILAAIYGVLVYWAGNNPVLFVFNTLAASIVILLVYEPIIARIERKTAELFSRYPYGMQQAVQKAMGKMADLVRLEDIQGFVLREITGLLGFGACSLYLFDSQARVFRLAGSHPPESYATRQIGGEDVVSLLAGMNSPLTRVDLEAGVREANPGREREALEALQSAIRETGAEVVVPLRSQEEARGLWCIGLPERSRSFTAAEVNLMGTLGSQIAVKLENAAIYSRLMEQDRLAALGEMAAGLAHEIKNPLGALKGAAQLIERAPQGGRTADMLRVIVDETDRLNDVLTRFLDYARPYSPRLETCDLGRLLSRTLELCRARDDVGRVVIEDRIEGNLDSVRCDPDLIVQAALNLLQNGLQALGGQGSLALGASRLEGIDGRRDWVEIVVSDTGKGIAPEDLPRLFQPFFTRRREGTGLGLAITKRIVEAQGGTITVESRLDEGTTFRVRIPDERGG